MNEANRERIIRGILVGQSDEIIVNGKTYRNTMRYGFRSSLKADYCVHNLGFRSAKDL